MKKLIFLIAMNISITSNALSFDDECAGFFTPKGIMANFPILKQRDTWEWYKKVRPEYVWSAETGNYAGREFKSNGFGFVVIIGAADLSKNHSQKGKIDDLVKFASKGAFLTKDSEYYSDNTKRDRIKLKTIVRADVIDNKSIGLVIADLEALELAKIGNPSHMRLTAILPEKEESYTCYPEIETLK
ncbi:MULTISPECIES: hypothetical protein [unclassified Delftia]|uniref:hypothetical protein n=1 Tax=unclassified Delftia TaxID=2613839 RepID=UPI0012E022CC|nr:MULTISPECIES: hypothetical protein [unclassified Delftia]MDC2862979.1 hypothetical protein [Delftia sp. DT-2]